VRVQDYLTKTVFDIILRRVRHDNASCAQQIFLGQNALACCVVSCRVVSSRVEFGL